MLASVQTRTCVQGSALPGLASSRPRAAEQQQPKKEAKLAAHVQGLTAAGREGVGCAACAPWKVTGGRPLHLKATSTGWEGKAETLALNHFAGQTAPRTSSGSPQRSWDLASTVFPPQSPWNLHRDGLLFVALPTDCINTKVVVTQHYFLMCT